MKFSLNGKNYELSDEKIYAAYRYQQHLFDLADCENTLQAMESAGRLKEDYGLSMKEAKKYMEEIVEMFRAHHDSTIDEESQWAGACEYVLDSHYNDDPAEQAPASEKSESEPEEKEPARTIAVTYKVEGRYTTMVHAYPGDTLEDVFRKAENAYCDADFGALRDIGDCDTRIISAIDDTDDKERWLYEDSTAYIQKDKPLF